MCLKEEAVKRAEIEEQQQQQQKHCNSLRILLVRILVVTFEHTKSVTDSILLILLITNIFFLNNKWFDLSFLSVLSLFIL